jgi:hypothetical protein
MVPIPNSLGRFPAIASKSGIAEIARLCFFHVFSGEILKALDLVYIGHHYSVEVTLSDIDVIWSSTWSIPTNSPDQP